VSDNDLLLVHSEEYIASLLNPKLTAEALELPLIGVFPHFAVKRIVSAYRCATEGTLLASRLAMSNGLAVNLGGGFHHARPNNGGGFCLFADIPVAIRNIRRKKRKLKVLVVDLDVHQGDGTIACMAGDKDTCIFSIHQSEIYPFPKEVGDLDVEITSGTGDDEYLSLLRTHLPIAFDQGKPDLVFYIAGADTLMEDPLSSVELTMDGLLERDHMVVDACREKGIPVVITLGGGYSANAWRAQFESIRNLIAG
jgi:histone deacetylase 11